MSETQTIDDRQPFRLHPRTVKLKRFLKDIEHHDTIPYEALNEVVGEDVRSDGEGACHLNTAIKHMRREHGRYFKRVGEGVAYLTNEQTANDLEKRVQNQGRAAKRIRDDATCLNIEALSPDDRQSCMSHLCAASLIVFASKPSAVKKIGAAVNGASVIPNAEKLLDCLRG